MIADGLSKQCAKCKTVSVDEAAFPAGVGASFVRTVIYGDSKQEKAAVEVVTNTVAETANPVESITFVGYSGGGNIAADTAKLLKDSLHINRIITLGTPRVILPAFDSTVPSNVDKLIMAWSYNDIPQTWAADLLCGLPVPCANGSYANIEGWRFTNDHTDLGDDPWYSSPPIVEWITNIILGR